MILQFYRAMCVIVGISSNTLICLISYCEGEAILHTLSPANRYLSSPGSQHMKLARWILWYLKGTKALRLTYKGQLQMLNGFSDAK